jgi:hypothetical protein
MDGEETCDAGRNEVRRGGGKGKEDGHKVQQHRDYTHTHTHTYTHPNERSLVAGGRRSRRR